MNGYSIATIVVIIIAAGYYYFLSQTVDLSKYIKNDQCWTNSPSHSIENDTTIKPFKVNISQGAIRDLNTRLKRIRNYATLQDTHWDYGTNADYILSLANYWQNHYNWRNHELTINNFNHYKTRIQGINVHFIHQTGSDDLAKKSTKVILMIHGWPGSFYEFYKVIPILVKANHTVIVPSIPGFGFSSPPEKSGLGTIETASIFIQLMQRLGYNHYYVQGGDWGSAIANAMAILDSKHCKGLHVNFVFMTAPNPILTYSIGSFFPSLFVPDPEERKRVFPFLQRIIEYSIEMSHFFLHSTRPDTLGLALHDSPLGLAAYIIEKFIRWSGCSNTSKIDCIEEKFTKDELITNVMIYWVTQTIVPSLRYYKESIFNSKTFELERVPISIPAGIANFPNEVSRPPRSWLSHRYKKIVTYNTMLRGGHFAALEEPDILARDVIDFILKSDKQYSHDNI
ncbi:Epoxide hydrolase 1 [Trichoplax sp. H2]|nr:Epoxide hydrolase 1 [Trichoplax sp. H2]|eukprot:RDD36686.1 Epoxide hydrolase 1 [Trichoplax sp. H2]